MATHSWDVNRCINKLSPFSSGFKTNSPSPRKAMTDSEISFADIKTAYDYIALIVARYGKTYLPLFERLHQEIDIIRSEEQLLELAFDVSSAKLSTEKNEPKTSKNISHIFSHVSHTMKFH